MEYGRFSVGIARNIRCACFFSSNVRNENSSRTLSDFSGFPVAFSSLHQQWEVFDRKRSDFPRWNALAEEWRPAKTSLNLMIHLLRKNLAQHLWTTSDLFNFFHGILYYVKQTNVSVTANSEKKREKKKTNAIGSQHGPSRTTRGTARHGTAFGIRGIISLYLSSFNRSWKPSPRLH